MTRTHEAQEREKLDLYREWFDALHDINPGYLQEKDYRLAKELYERLGRRVPDSIVEKSDAGRPADAGARKDLEGYQPGGSNSSPLTPPKGGSSAIRPKNKSHAAEEVDARERVAWLEAHVSRLSGCLLAISGAPPTVSAGSIRTAAYEAATMGASVEDIGRKLGNPVAALPRRPGNELEPIIRHQLERTKRAPLQWQAQKLAAHLRAIGYPDVPSPADDGVRDSSNG